MFTTGHDAANQEAFHAEPADTLGQVGPALRRPKKDVDKETKGLTLRA